jgi:hypothetical protein
VISMTGMVPHVEHRKGTRGACPIGAPRSGGREREL